MFYYSILLGYLLGYCQTENMNSYKLLSSTPITKFCPNETYNIYKIYEKHPDLIDITMCCATRISNRFMLTEKVCLKKFNPKYITVNKFNIYYYVPMLHYILLFDKLLRLIVVIK